MHVGLVEGIDGGAANEQGTSRAFVIVHTCFGSACRV
jgi:hypothetical protein